MQIDDDGTTECTAPQKISAHDESDISGAESSISQCMGLTLMMIKATMETSFVSTCEPGSPQFSHGGMYQNRYYTVTGLYVSIIRLLFLSL